MPFSLTAVDTPEELDSPLASRPAALAEHLAAEKALAARAWPSARADHPIAAFDTIVVLDGEVLGKPSDLPDAWRMLRALSGRTHHVVTGVAILTPEQTLPSTFSVVTDVRMKTLSDCQIEAWMASGEFMGCAGAYNIEAQIAEVDDGECFQNVAGLPLCHLAVALEGVSASCGLGEISHPVAACDAALSRQCVLGPRILGERSDSAS